MKLFVILFFISGMAIACPWDVACDLKDDGDSLNVIACHWNNEFYMRTGKQGKDILEIACSHDSKCVQEAYQKSPIEDLTIEGKNFSVTGTFCKSSQQKTTTKDYTLFTPAPLQYNGKSWDISGLLQVRDQDQTLYSMLAYNSPKGIFKTPAQYGSKICLQPVLDYNGPIRSWDSVYFGPEGQFLGGCILDYKDRLMVKTNFGMLDAYGQVFFHDNGQVESSQVHFTPLKVNGKKIYVTEMVLYDSGHLKSIEYVKSPQGGASSRMCFLENGTVIACHS